MKNAFQVSIVTYMCYFSYITLSRPTSQLSRIINLVPVVCEALSMDIASDWPLADSLTLCTLKIDL